MRIPSENFACADNELGWRKWVLDGGGEGIGMSSFVLSYIKACIREAHYFFCEAALMFQ